MFKLIKILPDVKNIAVRLSGGPDSSIIYYALCDYYKNTDVNIFPYTMASELRPHLIRKSQDVIDITTSLTSKSPKKHYIRWHIEHNSNNPHKVNSFEYVKGQELLEQTVYQENEIDIKYTGLSKNCPIDELTIEVNKWIINDGLDKHRAIPSLEYRDKERDTDLEGYDGPNADVSFPFLKYDKKSVYEAYVYYNLLEKLFPYTWSCEDDQQHLSDDPVHCGSCYFCLERRFAFGKV